MAYYVNGVLQDRRGVGVGTVIYREYSENGTDWHAARRDADLFGRAGTDNSTWHIFLLDSVANISNTPTPNAKHKIGFDEQGRLFGVRHGYNAATDATFDRWDALEHSTDEGEFAGEYYGEPAEALLADDAVIYDYQDHQWKELLEQGEDFGFGLLNLFEDITPQEALGSDAVWLMERRGQQDAANAIHNFDNTKEYYAFFGNHVHQLSKTGFVEAQGRTEYREWVRSGAVSQDIISLLTNTLSGHQVLTIPASEFDAIGTHRVSLPRAQIEGWQRFLSNSNTRAILKLTFQMTASQDATVVGSVEVNEQGNSTPIVSEGIIYNPADNDTVFTAIVAEITSITNANWTVDFELTSLSPANTVINFADVEIEFIPVYAVQPDWDETDTNSLAFIRNKPTTLGGAPKMSMWYRAGTTQRLFDPADDEHQIHGSTGLIAFTGGTAEETFGGGVDSGRVSWENMGPSDNLNADPVGTLGTTTINNCVLVLEPGTYHIKLRCLGHQLGDTNVAIRIRSIQTGTDDVLYGETAGWIGVRVYYDLSYEYLTVTSTEKLYFRLEGSTDRELTGYVYIEQVA